MQSILRCKLQHRNILYVTFNMQMTPFSNALGMQQQWDGRGNPSRAQKLYSSISCFRFQTAMIYKIYDIRLGTAGRKLSKPASRDSRKKKGQTVTCLLVILKCRINCRNHEASYRIWQNFCE